MKEYLFICSCIRPSVRPFVRPFVHWFVRSLVRLLGEGIFDYLFSVPVSLSAKNLRPVIDSILEAMLFVVLSMLAVYHSKVSSNFRFTRPSRHIV